MRAQHGATLLEILVTLVLTAIGLLGMASIQARSINDNYDAAANSRAMFLVTDLAERMRANMPGVWAGNYQRNSMSGSLVSSGANCRASDCTAATMASFDLAEWFNSRLRVELPDADATITSLTGGWSPTYTAASGSVEQAPLQVRIRLRWKALSSGDCNAAGSDADDGGYRCMETTIGL